MPQLWQNCCFIYLLQKIESIFIMISKIRKYFQYSLESLKNIPIISQYSWILCQNYIFLNPRWRNFRCSFRWLLSISDLQTGGSSSVSVWSLTRFRRWICGGIVVQVFLGLEPMLFGTISCFRCIQSPCFVSFLWSPFADFVVSKDSDICWIFDGFFWVYKDLSSKKCSFKAKVSSKMCDWPLKSWLFFFIKLSCNKPK